MRRFSKGKLIFILALSVLCVASTATALGQEAGPKFEPARYAMGITAGNSYTPENDISFGLLTGFALLDYGKVWGHKAPEALRFKLEASLGSTTRPDRKLMASVNMFALYYLKSLAKGAFRPYVEGGIGFIYTDFQVEGQGLRLNFNPQMGIGAEFAFHEETVFFAALRLHHISNAGLNHDNTGVNSVTLTLGRFF